MCHGRTKKSIGQRKQGTRLQKAERAISSSTSQKCLIHISAHFVKPRQISRVSKKVAPNVWRQSLTVASSANFLATLLMFAIRPSIRFSKSIQTSCRTNSSPATQNRAVRPLSVPYWCLKLQLTTAALLFGGG